MSNITLDSHSAKWYSSRSIHIHMYIYTYTTIRLLFFDLRKLSHKKKIDRAYSLLRIQRKIRPYASEYFPLYTSSSRELDKNVPLKRLLSSSFHVYTHSSYSRVGIANAAFRHLFIIRERKCILKFKSRDESDFFVLRTRPKNIADSRAFPRFTLAVKNSAKNRLIIRS